MVRWQGKKICAIKLLMNLDLDSNAHYYIVSTQYWSPSQARTSTRGVVCHVSRVTCYRAELRIATERGDGGDWAGTLARADTASADNALHAACSLTHQ